MIMNIKSEIDLMVFMMKAISEKFRSQAIIRGGMALYLLNSKRYTNDLDYAFVPFKSKKDILKPLLELLDSIENLKYQYELNSQCLRVSLDYQGFKSQLEIKTYSHLKSMAISTEALPEIKMPSFIVRIADLEWSLSNKIAAWLERRLAKDLYDIYYLYTFLNVRPDLQILNKRLKKIEFARNLKNAKTSLSLVEFIELLRKEVINLNPQKLKNELGDYFTKQELLGIELKITIALNSICEYLETSIRHKDSTTTNKLTEFA